MLIPCDACRKDEFKKPELKPRSQSQKTKEWKAKKEAEADKEGYRDRAKERRQGLEGDFLAAEKLLQVSSSARLSFAPFASALPADSAPPSRGSDSQEFQERAQTAEIDKQTLEEQMKYLVSRRAHLGGSESPARADLLTAKAVVAVAPLPISLGGCESPSTLLTDPAFCLANVGRRRRALCPRQGPRLCAPRAAKVPAAAAVRGQPRGPRARARPRHRPQTHSLLLLDRRTQEEVQKRPVG